MNNDRRKRLAKAIEHLDEAKAIIDEVASDEQMAFDNLPESFQDGARGNAMTEVIEALEAIDLDDAIEAINEITEQ